MLPLSPRQIGALPAVGAAPSQRGKAQGGSDAVPVLLLLCAPSPVLLPAVSWDQGP